VVGGETLLTPPPKEQIMDNTETTTTTTTPRTKKFWIGGIAAAVALVLASVGITLAVTEGFDDDRDDDTTSQEVRTDGGDTTGTADATDADDVAISDADRSKAEKAALATPEAKGGTVTDVERSNDADHAYEVDVQLADGTDVDVELDESFSVTRVDTN
jgi:uncharacterized membrane protein YkoI